METQILKKEMNGNIEYLIELLHREWERSGKTAVQVAVSLSDARKVKRCMAAEITGKQKQLEKQELTFRQAMDLSKENFVLLRLARKIKTAEEMTAKEKSGPEFRVEFDQEEYGIFQEMFQLQEE